MARRAAAGVAVVVALVGSILGVSAIRSAGAQGGGFDGSTAALAAPSCWSIKQDDPGAADGAYWLRTTSMDVAARFWCDMTTDGGGWVLIGRGREGWWFDASGQGDPDQLWQTPDGTGAFAPVALANATVDELLDGTPMRDLADGLRIHRAANNAGTVWQEVGWDFRSLGDFAWWFEGDMPLDAIDIDGVVYTADDPNTRDYTAVQDSLSRLFTFGWSANDYERGFAYGTAVTGNPSPTSYIWSVAGERGIPFSQVYVRPQVTTGGGERAPLPDAGLPAEPAPLQMSNDAAVLTHGVAGLMPDTATSTPAVEAQVWAFAELGNTIFVGGKFADVRTSKNDPAPIDQPYLAAFTRDTGTYRPGFTPALDGVVYDLEITPSGQLLVAGEFNSVDGVANTAGLALLDPTTGAVDPDWRASVEWESSADRGVVRAVDIQDNWVYVGGAFTHITGGPNLNRLYALRVGRVRLDNGRPNGAWTPHATQGPVWDLDATATRVWLAGRDQYVAGDIQEPSISVIDVATAAPVVDIDTWQPNSVNRDYQQTLLVVDDQVVIGGSEHNIHWYSADDMTLRRAHITTGGGGDFQAITVIGDKLFAGCHCWRWHDSNTNLWPGPHDRTARHDVNFVASYDATSGEFDPAFEPWVGGPGEGAWALHGDADNCLWNGGDFDTGPGGRWIGGMAKHCPVDEITPPVVPSGLGGQYAAGGFRLSWTAATDNIAVTGYEIIREDAGLVGTVGGTAFTDPGAVDGSRYVVRALDAAGNRSASTPVITAGPPPAGDPELVVAGALWRYSADGTDPGPAWTALGFDASGWASGPAELGYGDGGEATVINQPTGYPTTYFRHELEVPDPSEFASLVVGLQRDDGAVVHINGVEVARSKMPTGIVDGTSLASSYTWGADETTFHPYVVPAAVLQPGTNVVAVEVHQADAWNADNSFDLTLTGRFPGSDVTPPTSPAPLNVVGITETTVSLTWSPAADNIGVAGYIVRRDGAIVGSTTALELVDVGLSPATSYDWSVTAFDANGNESAAATASATTVDPAGGPTLVAAGADWRYLDTGVQPSPNWMAVGFNDSAWGSGPAELGWGDGDEATSVAPANGFPTTYFRHEFSVADPTRWTSLDIGLVRDDGAVVYINGVEVARDKMPPGPISGTTVAIDYTWGDDESTFHSFTAAASLLRVGTNVVAVEIHQGDPYNADMSFDLTLAGGNEPPPPTAQNLVPAGSTWSYRDTGVDLGTGWRNPGFDDSAWPSGPAQLGYGDGDEATAITKPTAFPTTYFRHEFDVVDPSAFSVLDLGVVRDDGVVVYLNGVEVARDKMPAGAIDGSTLATDYTWGADELTFHPFLVPASLLVSGTNVVAVEIHQADPWNNDNSFDLSLVAKP